MNREEKRRLATVFVVMLDGFLVGNPAPAVGERYRRMKHVESGDLVIEISTIRWLIQRDPDLLDDRWDGQLVPYLRDEIRFIEGDPEDELDDGYEDHVIVVQNPDGTEFAWDNAEIMAVPTDLDFGRKQ